MIEPLPSGEQELAGGNMNAVVRAGDTVRRAAGAWTETIHRLLRHVRARGILWAPEPLGLDDQGREILSFLPGISPSYPLADWVWFSPLLVEAGQRLRAFHDATVDFPDDTAVWQVAALEPAEVICHNDFAPYNFVCTDGTLTGVIDFDMASPGSRIWDLAYLAYRLCPLASLANPDARRHGDAFSINEQEQRLDLLLTAYGATFTARETMVVAIERLDELARFSEQRARETGQVELANHAALYRTDATELRQRLVS